MLRVLLEGIAAIIVILAVRSILSAVLKGFSDMFHPAPQADPKGSSKPLVPAGGELKKDPVCGTFISTATALQKKFGGETYYFCSPECQQKFKG